jgi:tRNA(Ile)-lysidine synthase
MGLAGMSPRARIGGLLILRPMVGVRRDVLRQLLAERKLSWREDSSNRSPKFLRNRLRDLLQDNEQLTVALLDLSARCRDLRDWARRTAPVMAEQFPAVSLARLPSILATESAKQWLADRGVPLSRLDPPTITRLVEMAVDAATPSRQQFAGGITIARRAGIISAHGSRE